MLFGLALGFLILAFATAISLWTVQGMGITLNYPYIRNFLQESTHGEVVQIVVLFGGHQKKGDGIVGSISGTSMHGNYNIYAVLF